MDKKVTGEALSERLGARLDEPAREASPLLMALARADRPEQLLDAIRANPDVSGLPTPVQRVVRQLEREAERQGLAASQSSGGGLSDDEMTLMSPQARVPGSDNTMKLARRLQRLVMLAESDRRILEARRSVRMAEDTAEARQRADFSAPGGKRRAVDVEALGREVLENVSRMKESRQDRRSEDPDDISIWW